MTKKDLRGKLTVITGGARGIGRATAAEFLRAGARVAIADIDADVAERTARDLSASGEIHPYRLDVTNRSEFDRVVDRIERERGAIDIFVNNAGIMSLGKFLEHDEASDRRQVDINLFGVLHGMRAVLPRMQARGRGHIVNVASMAGRVGIPCAATYTATKFAVIGATEALRAELRGSGIDFTYVMPYLVNTDLASGTRGLKWPPVVQPDEVARAIVDAVERGKVEVYVPRIGRLTTLLPVILPRKAVDWIATNLGLDRIFAKVDTEKRAAYIARTTGRGASSDTPRPGHDEPAAGEKPTSEKPKVRVVGE